MNTSKSRSYLVSRRRVLWRHDGLIVLKQYELLKSVGAGTVYDAKNVTVRYTTPVHRRVIYFFRVAKSRRRFAYKNRMY